MPSRGAELPLSANDSTTTYAANATYTPAGALAALALGGGSINLNEAYSSRLQPTRIQASSSGGADLLDLAYDFELGTADNGNVQAIINGRDNSRSQSFAYDALNRITLARTQATTGQNAWGQAFGYDPWGNLLTTALTQGAAPSFSVAANAQNQIVGYCYDASGNLLDPNACPSGNPHTYAYNAEGQMVSAVAGAYTYTYDGDGQRVKKSSGKLYWYGQNGEVLTETGLAGNLTDDYVFFGGKRLARVDASGNVDYYFSDQIGSSRVVTDSAGNLLDDCDFYPFGWDRCVASSSGNTYKFTGKERDSESSLDDFGARYYGSSLGRFMSVDPDNAGADPSDPQTWNMYAYAGNNPTTLTDPTGLYICGSSMTESQCDSFAQSLTGAQSAANVEKATYGDLSSQYLNAQRAIDAYGDRGVDNGVTIQVGGLSPGEGAEMSATGGSPVTADNPNGQNISVTFNTKDFNADAGSAALAITSAHEGSHVADASDWVSSGFDKAMLPTSYATESRAFGVSAAIAEGSGAYPNGLTFGSFTIWQPMWNAGQVQQGINQLLAAPRSAGGIYQVTPAHPGSVNWRRRAKPWWLP